MARLQTLRPQVPAARAGKVPAHTVAANIRTRGNTWARLREQVLARDMGLCQCEDCKARGLLTPAHEVDHIRPLFEGGSDALDNLQAISRECHARKTRAENARRAGKT